MVSNRWVVLFTRVRRIVRVDIGTRPSIHDERQLVRQDQPFKFWRRDRQSSASTPDLMVSLAWCRLDHQLGRLTTFSRSTKVNSGVEIQMASERTESIRTKFPEWMVPSVDSSPATGTVLRVIVVVVEVPAGGVLRDRVRWDEKEGICRTGRRGRRRQIRRIERRRSCRKEDKSCVSPKEPFFNNRC
jgi:hypothetical protein